MNWIKEIEKLDLSKNQFSQYGEECVIAHILKNIGVHKHFFVDIGAGGAGRGLSNTLKLISEGWNGLSFDMDGSEGTIKEFIKPSNIVRILQERTCPLEFDFLSVDIDSFDYDIIKNVLKDYTPSLICAEYNGTLDPMSKVKLRYEDGYTWDGTNKYGFSYGAGKKLFTEFDYTIVHVHKETNIFAVHNSLISESDKIKIETPKQNLYHPINPKAEWVTV